jgi:hypothetical protein
MCALTESNPLPFKLELSCVEAYVDGLKAS